MTDKPTIHLVIALYGDYPDDHEEWVVAAFLTEEVARDCAKQRNIAGTDLADYIVVSVPIGEIGRWNI